MKLNINNKEIELVYSFRSAIYFEQIVGHDVNVNNFSQNDMLTLFYAVVIASLQKAKEPIISFIDFMDVVDDNGGNKCLIDFSNWYVGVARAEYEALQDMAPEEEEKEKPKKSTKKKN
jgi:hypothetical protein